MEPKMFLQRVILWGQPKKHFRLWIAAKSLASGERESGKKERTDRSVYSSSHGGGEERKVCLQQ
jgi:hypothetical protein